MTHAGQSYGGRSTEDMATIAEAERGAVVRAAERLVAGGHACPVVSMGSSPTALHAAGLAGVTEVRAGVYMFGDLFQAAIGTHGMEDIAVTVLTSVIGRRPGRMLVDAGGLALSKDRSTEAAPRDFRYGLALDCARGAAASGREPGAAGQPGARHGGVLHPRWSFPICRWGRGCGLRRTIRA